jgi:hypothetical protein
MSYVDDRLTAADMLAEDGQTVTLTYVGTSSYDSATSTTTNTAPDPETVSGAILPLSIAIRYGFKQTGSLIVEGDQQLLLSAQNTAGVAIAAPQVNGTITDTNGNAWTIIAVDPLNPAGTAVLFDCVIRRAA